MGVGIPVCYHLHHHRNNWLDCHFDYPVHHYHNHSQLTAEILKHFIRRFIAELIMLCTCLPSWAHLYVLELLCLSSAPNTAYHHCLQHILIMIVTIMVAILRMMMRRRWTSIMIAQGLFSQTDCLDIILQNNRLSPNMSIMLQSRFVVRFIGF